MTCSARTALTMDRAAARPAKNDPRRLPDSAAASAAQHSSPEPRQSKCRPSGRSPLAARSSAETWPPGCRTKSAKISNVRFRVPPLPPAPVHPHSLYGQGIVSAHGNGGASCSIKSASGDRHINNAYSIDFIGYNGTGSLRLANTE
jgi:hypothetical protein